VNERRLRERLRGCEPPDPDARDRAWRVVRAAYDEYVPRRARRPTQAVAVGAAVLAVLIVAMSTSAPGDAVARWVQRVLGAGQPDARPALVAVPGGGRLLVIADPGAWVVARDGSKRLLGRYDGASWSPHGLFVLAWRGGELTAVEPSGRVRWSLARREPIRAAAWSSVDGFRVAYLAGPQLRVVNGDGTGDRPYRDALAKVAPAWRPDNTHVLAYLDGASRVRVEAVDARQTLWRGPRLDRPHKLAWSPDGRRLLALTSTKVVVFSRGGEMLHEHTLATGTLAEDAAWAPGGNAIALARRHPKRQRADIVLVTPGARGRQRLLFTGPGRFGPLAWSPNGEWLLVSWPQADQWLFLRPDTDAAVSAVANIARQFDPGTSGAPAFPVVAGWCCSPDQPGP